LKKKTND